MTTDVQNLCGIDSGAGEKQDSTGSTFESRRLIREWKTIAAMIQCYCKDHHGARTELCQECSDLLAYATLRLKRCRFGIEKPTCANCPVHCYKPERREQIRVVMRYAGPKMLWRHPILSLWHLVDGYRKAPSLQEI